MNPVRRERLEDLRTRLRKAQKELKDYKAQIPTDRTQMLERHKEERSRAEHRPLEVVKALDASKKVNIQRITDAFEEAKARILQELDEGIALLKAEAADKIEEKRVARAKAEEDVREAFNEEAAEAKKSRKEHLELLEDNHAWEREDFEITCKQGIDAKMGVIAEIENTINEEFPTRVGRVA